LKRCSRSGAYRLDDHKISLARHAIALSLVAVVWPARILSSSSNRAARNSAGVRTSGRARQAGSLGLQPVADEVGALLAIGWPDLWEGDIASGVFHAADAKTMPTPTIGLTHTKLLDEIGGRR
jgi:hypothetical protein